MNKPKVFIGSFLLAVAVGVPSVVAVQSEPLPSLDSPSVTTTTNAPATKTTLSQDYIDAITAKGEAEAARFQSQDMASQAEAERQRIKAEADAESAQRAEDLSSRGLPALPESDPTRVDPSTDCKATIRFGESEGSFAYCQGVTQWESGYGPSDYEKANNCVLDNPAVQVGESWTCVVVTDEPEG